MAQCLLAVLGHAGRRGERPSHDLAAEHDLQHLLLAVVGELRDQRDVRQLGRLGLGHVDEVIDLLLGDPSKAKRELGWTLKTSFEQLVNMMTDSDLKDAEKLK